MNRINDFLLSLASDSEKLARFENDPDQILLQTDLSEEEKQIVKSKDPRRIRLATFRRGAGSLTVVGLGIKLIAHSTFECRNSIQSADRVLYAASEGAAAQWIESLNPKSESVDLLYQANKPRIATYEATVERILSCVRAGYRVCAAYYGHPGIFVYATHEAMRRARKQGFSVQMLPGISAEDCLFADLGIDPGRHGYQSFEATHFLSHKKTFSICNSLVLWQIGMLGEMGYKPGPNRTDLRLLSEYLITRYSSAHRVKIYEAAQYPITEPLIRDIPLGELENADLSPYSTLFIPPQDEPKVDRVMLMRLGVS